MELMCSFSFSRLPALAFELALAIRSLALLVDCEPVDDVDNGSSKSGAPEVVVVVVVGVVVVA